MNGFTRMFPCAIVLALAASNAARVEAADDQQIRERLERTKTASCTFSTMATVDLVNGQSRASTKPSTLSMAFDTINIDEGSARVALQSLTVDVVVRLSNGVLHFLESFREGPLYTTTIFPVASENGRLMAVHSRHEFTQVHVPGYTSRPEQYYGTCAIDP